MSFRSFGMFSWDRCRLVGPRPVVEEELGLYGEKQDVVLSVRPGITGAWAVNGRQLLGYPERCSIELAYVQAVDGERRSSDSGPNSGHRHAVGARRDILRMLNNV